MKTLILIVFPLIGILTGCSTVLDTTTVHHTGPVTVAHSIFDYHITIKGTDGYEREFYWDHYQPTTEGDVIDIAYTGSGSSITFSATVVGIKVISGKEPKEKHIKDLLTTAGYYDLSVTVQEDPHDNSAFAKKKGYLACLATWQARSVTGNTLQDGLVCDDKVVVTETW